MTTLLFTNLLERLASVSWRSVFEHTRTLQRFLIKISAVTTEHVNRESAIVGRVLAIKVFKMSRTSGLLFKFFDIFSSVVLA